MPIQKSDFPLSSNITLHTWCFSRSVVFIMHQSIPKTLLMEYCSSSHTTGVYDNAMPRLSDNQRNQAIGMLQAGVSKSDVARRFGCHPSSVSRLVSRFTATNSVKDLPRSGRPRKTTPADDRRMVLKTLRNRRLSARQIAEDLRRRHIIISAASVRRRLRRGGLKSCRPFKGLVLTQVHRRNRLAWCRHYRNWT